MIQSSRPAWRRVGPPLSRIEDLDPTPLFDPASGQTHFLTELPLLLLEALSQAPRTAEALVLEFAGPVTLDDKASGLIASTLCQLAEVGLIESCDPD